MKFVVLYTDTRNISIGDVVQRSIGPFDDEASANAYAEAFGDYSYFVVTMEEPKKMPQEAAQTLEEPKPYRGTFSGHEPILVPCAAKCKDACPCFPEEVV